MEISVTNPLSLLTRCSSNCPVNNLSRNVLQHCEYDTSCFIISHNSRVCQVLVTIQDLKMSVYQSVWESATWVYRSLLNSAQRLKDLIFHIAR